MNKRGIVAAVVLVFTFLLFSLSLPSALSVANSAEKSALKVTSDERHPAVTSARQVEIRNLTSTLVNEITRYRFGDNSTRLYLKGRLQELANQRYQMLSEMVEVDPAEVLRVAMPVNIRAGLPQVILKNVEEQVELAGELEVLYECSDQGSRLLHFIKANGEHLSLHFASKPPTDLQTGSLVRVKGVRVGEAIALESGNSTILSFSDTGLQAVTSVLPNTYGAQRTLVILVNFQDNMAQPYTVDYARNVVFNTTSNFDLENSFQQTWLTGDVTGWYTIPVSSTTCDTASIATYAKQAAQAAGYNLSNYNHYIYAFPINACSWWGLGSVGGNPSETWISGNLTVKVVSHEMGHNFGLYHSHALDCSTSPCRTIEYGDTLDSMGNPTSGHFTAYQKERLGWLNAGIAPPLTTVQASGNYWLDPYETAGSNSKALKILKSTDPTTGQRTYYYVEFRQANGFDSFLSGNTNVLNGVVVHTGTDTDATTCNLLNMAPALGSWSTPALPVGQSFTDSTAGVTITPVSVGSTGAMVSITYSGPACAHASPTLSVSPSQSQWVRSGTTVTYTVSVANNDNSGCAPSSFTLQASVPSGWTATFASPSLSVNPGSSASTTLRITSPSSAADGFYNVGVTATNSGASSYTASRSVTYVVVSSLNVTVSTNASSYTRTQSATITGNVIAIGSPVSGASVTFTITKPNGTTATGTATTGANGSAVYVYNFNKKKDPAGTYQVRAVGSMSGASGSATTSFTAQ